MKSSQNRVYIYLTIPALIVILVLLIAPIINGIKISLTNYDLLRQTNDFIGLRNYIKALSDSSFYLALLRNIIYVIIVVSFNFLIGFGMAYVCAQKFFGNKLIRFIIILPMLLIPASAAVLWKFMYNYDIGVINILLEFLHIPRVEWLINPNLALFSVIITDIWAWTPWMFLILLAGLENLNKETIEAARIDGASGFSFIRLVVWPMMAPVISVAISLKAIETFRTFDYVWVMTMGGPGNSSDILSTFIYKSAFKNMKYGYASALSIIVLIIMVVLSFYLVRNFVVRRGELD